MRADSIVLKTIKDRKLIAEGDVLLLGLSGGPDSLCLLDILSKLQSELSFSLYALHVNHMIRGEEADADMEAVKQFCLDRNINLTVKIANVPEIAAKEGLGEEETGRIVRQKALKQKQSELRKANPQSHVKIVLAHNKDDQAETVLMRILRGSGVHGLAAMEYIRADGLIRPLLDTPRSLIEEYCKENELNPCIDSSNQSLEYTRNKLRLRLIPVIEREFNPNFKDGLVRLAESAREDDTYLNALAKKQLPQIVIKRENAKPEEFNSMPVKQLLSMDTAVAKRVVKLMLARCGLKSDISSVHMKALIDALNAGGNSTIEFPKGYKAVIEYGKVSFRASDKKGFGRKDEKSEGTQASENSVVKLRISCKVFPVEYIPPLNTLGSDMCALDALKILALDSDLYVRTRRAGDMIKPLNGPGTKKLQDYYTDSKISKEERDNIKLLCCDHTVLWVKGHTVSDLCKIDEDTDFVLVTKIEEEKEIE